MHLLLTVLFQMNLGGQGNAIGVGVPVHLGVTGLYDVEFRIVVACRDGCIYLVRRGWTQARTLVQLPALAVVMVVLPENSSIVIGLMNETLHGYSKKVGTHKYK
jgi:Bardet-Biedl syndrome 1 protein